jgi:SAM-dependent methyltransferase
MSIGVKDSSGIPPKVPRIPDIDLMSAKVIIYYGGKLTKFSLNGKNTNRMKYLRTMLPTSNSTSEWFAEWFDSPYYHLLYQHRSHDEARAFIQTLLQFLQLPTNNRLLDVACGKGRHAKALADAGYFVTGIDLSPDSIQSAQALANENLEFFVHDMRHLFRTRYYHAVFNLFTSFGYFSAEHDNTLAARAMASALLPGGLLVVDFVNREPACANIEANQHEIIEREGVRFTLHRSYTKQHYIKQIDVQDGEQQATFFEKVSAFTPAQLEAYFKAEGLVTLHLFGNYACEAYDIKSSPRMIFIFQRPE